MLWMFILLGTLYSFRRCPYAMRARLAIQLCLPNGALELREVVLKNKPQAMLKISPKATVPVLQLNSGQIIDESIDIARWAFSLNTELSETMYAESIQAESDALISENDGDFKWALDRYKYSDRFEHDEEYYREKAKGFLAQLEDKLSDHTFLIGNQMTLADIAVFPFVRQFAHVDKKWFDQQKQYHNLKQWLNGLLEGELFVGIMKKYPAWKEGDEPTYFPNVK